MPVCELCGKAPHFGYAVSHSKRHTPRRWEPNVRKKSVLTNGKTQRLYICTRCLRSRSKLSK